jgi:hypothetical protein
MFGQLQSRDWATALPEPAFRRANSSAPNRGCLGVPLVLPSQAHASRQRGEACNQHQAAGDQPIQRCALRSGGEHGFKRLGLQLRHAHKRGFPAAPVRRQSASGRPVRRAKRPSDGQETMIARNCRSSAASNGIRPEMPREAQRHQPARPQDQSGIKTASPVPTSESPPRPKVCMATASTMVR